MGRAGTSVGINTASHIRLCSDKLWLLSECTDVHREERADKERNWREIPERTGVS